MRMPVCLLPEYARGWSWNLIATSTLRNMDKATKAVGDALRERIPVGVLELPKTMRRLITELERRDAERDREADRSKIQKPS